MAMPPSTLHALKSQGEIAAPEPAALTTNSREVAIIVRVRP